MRKTTAYLFWLLLVVSAWTPVHSGTGLPYSTIKNYYKEGEFEKIRVNLESFLKKNGKSAELKERIFAYKYLGVIYAAEPQGYPLAETYFYQLLKLAPTAHLSDMYVSTSIEAVFDRTRERFRKESQENSDFDEFGNPRNRPDPNDALATPETEANPRPYPTQPGDKPDPLAPKKPQKGKETSIRVWPWVLGLGVAGAVAGYFWYSSLQEKKKPTVINPEPV